MVSSRFSSSARTLRRDRAAAGAMKADPRRIAIEHATRVVALKLYARELTAAEAVASLAAVIDPDRRAPDATPRENVTAVRARQRAEMIAEMKRLEQEGRGREAAGIVAAQFAKDRLDPIEVESLTRK